MVRTLEPPLRPLPKVRSRWVWKRISDVGSWRWCRVYHQSSHTPDGVTFRRFGPLYRLDHHHEAVPPTVDESGRRILYIGVDLVTSACEVFGESGVAQICPRYRVSIVAPTRPVPMFDMTRTGTALAIGALPALADGSEARSLTRQWARAIYEDQPAGSGVCGVRYRTAYNFGYSLALWDCDESVEIVRNGAGRVLDLPLNDARLLARLEVQLRARRINVTTVSSDQCGQCKAE